MSDTATTIVGSRARRLDVDGGARIEADRAIRRVHVLRQFDLADVEAKRLDARGETIERVAGGRQQLPGRARVADVVRAFANRSGSSSRPLFPPFAWWGASCRSRLALLPSSCTAPSTGASRVARALREAFPEAVAVCAAAMLSAITLLFAKVWLVISSGPVAPSGPSTISKQCGTRT